MEAPKKNDSDTKRMTQAPKRMTRTQAIRMLVDYNIPFTPKDESAVLIAKAKEIVPEPYYLCEIIDNGQTKLIPWVKVNGKVFMARRGEKVYIRKRFLDVLKQKVLVIDPGDDKTGSFKATMTANEIVQIIKEVPESEVPRDKR